MLRSMASRRFDSRTIESNVPSARERRVLFEPVWSDSLSGAGPTRGCRQSQATADRALLHFYIRTQLLARVSTRASENVTARVDPDCPRPLCVIDSASFKWIIQPVDSAESARSYSGSHALHD